MASSSHYSGHTQLDIAENWTLAIGHSILPARGTGGIKFEDIIQITPEGGRNLNNVEP